MSTQIFLAMREIAITFFELGVVKEFMKKF